MVMITNEILICKYIKLLKKFPPQHKKKDWKKNKTHSFVESILKHNFITYLMYKYIKEV